LVPKQAKAQSTAAPPRRRREVSRRELFGIGGAVVGSMVLFQIFRWVSGGSDVAPTGLPEISSRELDAAALKWQAAGPKNYDLHMTVVSNANETNMHLEVRNGEGRRLVRNEIESTRPEEMSQWTVEGQMAQIAAYIERDTSVAAQNAGMQMVNVGRLHPELGYPLEYSRQGTGDQTKFHITVTKFQPIEP
jgi:hypothetical protein